MDFNLFQLDISDKICPFLTGAIQCEIEPVPLPIRDAIDFLVTGEEGKTRIQILPVLRNPRRRARRQASICL